MECGRALEDLLDELNIHDKQQEKVEQNSLLISSLKLNLNCDFQYDPHEVYRLIDLDRNNYKYIEIDSRFVGGMIQKIQKVENVYLYELYELNKIIFRKCYGVYPDELEVFHATSFSNVDSICRNNFNWRLFGTSRGHRYGKGVSFSPRNGFAAMFARKFCQKVMFVVNVLVKNSVMGHTFMDVPPEGFDTATRELEKAYIKFDDNMFYPSYIIHYI